MTSDLKDFFSAIGKAKKEKEDEVRSLVGEIDIDSMFSQVKVSLEEDKKKKETQKKQIAALESWLYAEVEEKKEEIIEASTPIVLPYEEVEIEEEVIEDNEEEVDVGEETEEDTVDHALKILETIKSKEEVRENVNDPEIVKIRGEIEYLKNLVNAQGGGGEVRLEFLDDVDRTTAKVDGKVLAWSDSVGKFIGTTMSAGGITTETQTLNTVLGLGNVSSSGMSVGVVTATELHVGVDTGFFTEDLVVNGDARITGILSVGTATITLDPDANIVRIGTGITLNANTNSIEVGGSKVADTSGNAEYSGIVTASSFVGNLTGTATTATNAEGLTGSPNIAVNSVVASSNIGIGLTNPSHMLHLKSAGDARIHIQADSDNSGENDNPRISFSQDGSSDTWLFQIGLEGYGDATMNGSLSNAPIISADNGNLNGPIQIGHLKQTIMTIKNGSYTDPVPLVGIGTNNPTSALDVAGDANVTGVVTASSFVGNLSGDSTGLSGSPSITVTDITASGNVSIGGTLTYEDVTNVDSIGIITARSGIEIGGPVILNLNTSTSTTTSTSQDPVDTFSVTDYRSASYQIQITRGTEYHVTSLNIVHDGTDVYVSEFGTINTGSILATFTADINSGNVRILATPSSATSTVFKMYRNLIRT